MNNKTTGGTKPPEAARKTIWEISVVIKSCGVEPLDQGISHRQ